MDPARVLQGVLRGRPQQYAVPAVVLPVHRAVARGRHPVPPRQGRDPLRRGRGLAGDFGLRHGASECAARLRHRSRRLSGLRLGHGHRPHRDAEIRHVRPAAAIRERRALAWPLRLQAARRPDAGGRIEFVKFTLSWLKEHLDTDEPLEKLADKLTMIGLEVENIDDKAKALAPFTIARVISAEQQPNADLLRVCMVDPGNGAAPVQVVCGAPNARAGLVSVFSPPGTYIPGKDITLGIGTIRGVESRGMLCSAAELQISEDHDGIMELPAD